MRDELDELYDYDALRQLSSPTMLIVRTAAPTFVLGGSQPVEVLDEARRQRVALRRRRGGGGVVLLQPDDVWVDWWFPADDARWTSEVRVVARRVGEWWRVALSDRLARDVRVHAGALEGDPVWRVACFAGRGPGEVFVDDRKAVGLTQWRVREGVFLSSVLHAHPSDAILDLLANVPDGLGDALAHHTLESLDLDGDDVTAALVTLSHPVDVRQLFLLA